jgi:hypothetical protein
LILGAGIFKINPTPQQITIIFRKITFVRSLSSWCLQSNRRTVAAVAGHSGAASEVSLPFYIINIGIGTPITKSQPKLDLCGTTKRLVIVVVLNLPTPFLTAVMDVQQGSMGCDYKACIAVED